MPSTRTKAIVVTTGLITEAFDRSPIEEVSNRPILSQGLVAMVHLVPVQANHPAGLLTTVTLDRAGSCPTMRSIAFQPPGSGVASGFRVIVGPGTSRVETWSLGLWLKCGGLVFVTSPSTLFSRIGAVRHFGCSQLDCPSLDRPCGIAT